MFQKVYFGIFGDTYILVYYPLVSYQRKEFYRVETMDMGNIPLKQWRQWNILLQSQ